MLFLVLQFLLFAKKVSSGDIGIRFSTLDLTWMLTHSAKSLQICGSEVLLYKHMILTGFVHLDCCGGAASGVPSKCECYQGGA